MAQTSKEVMAEALLVWRYSRHAFYHGGTVPTNESEQAVYRALDVAREFGFSAEYFALLMRHPVLTVAVAELEPERKAVRKRRRKTPTKGA